MIVADEVKNGEPYHFKNSWVTHRPGANPANLKIMHVEGDSMMPTGEADKVDEPRRIGR